MTSPRKRKEADGKKRTERWTTFRSSCLRPIVAQPARKASLTDLACSERNHHGGCPGLIRREAHAVLAQQRHHGDERNPLVTVHESVILGEAKRIAGRELGQPGLLVVPFVGWSLER